MITLIIDGVPVYYDREEQANMVFYQCLSLKIPVRKFTDILVSSNKGARK